MKGKEALERFKKRIPDMSDEELQEALVTLTRLEAEGLFKRFCRFLLKKGIVDPVSVAKAWEVFTFDKENNLTFKNSEELYSNVKQEFKRCMGEKNE